MIFWKNIHSCYEMNNTWGTLVLKNEHWCSEMKTGVLKYEHSLNQSCFLSSTTRWLLFSSSEVAITSVDYHM